MPADNRRRPLPKQQLSTGTLVDMTSEAVSRLLSEQADATALTATPATRTVIAVSLAIGANRINHGLGRTARVAIVTPSVADATFAYALTAADAKQAIVTVVGVAQPSCTVEFA